MILNIVYSLRTEDLESCRGDYILYMFGSLSPLSPSFI
jgi:hypothetical protein